MVPASVHAMSIHWPSPVRLRWISPARMATAIVLAPMWSMYEKPHPAGGSPARPELNVSPETACTMGPHVLNATFGPQAPNPQFDT